MKYVLLTLIIGLSFVLKAQSIDTKKIGQSIDRAQLFLMHSQQPEGYFADSTNNLFNTWETVIVAKALLTVNDSNRERLEPTFNWLRSEENESGLICHNNRCRGGVCLETSALYLQLLNQKGDTNSLRTRFGLLTKDQLVSGSWNILNPYVKGDRSYPSVPAFLLNTSTLTGIPINGRKKAIQFLHTQFSDSGFTANWEYYGTPAYTIWQALNACREDSILFEKMKIFVIENQQEDGSWNFQDSLNSRPKISSELETAFLLNALVQCQDPNLTPIIIKACDFLIRKQKNSGCWDGGRFPIENPEYVKLEYLLCTSLVVESFSLLLKE